MTLRARVRVSAVRAGSARRRGFSVLELVIVIGIIVVLAGLVLAVGQQMLAKSEDRAAQATMALLDSAIQDWERAADRAVSYGVDGQPPNATYPPKYDIQELQTFGSITDFAPKGAIRVFSDAVIKHISGNATTETILKNIPSDNLIQEAGPGASIIQVLMDPWGKPIVIVFPGRKWVASDGGGADDDGTIQTVVEERYGVCKNGKILFVSVGPDGLPGDRSETDKGDADYIATQDNIYSYPPFTP